jgi:hypothetical protein
LHQVDVSFDFLKFLGRCTLVFLVKLNGQKVKALGSD